ncbi:MAG: hypothetical protein LC104_09120 [Bacteroidales bacterium]|nr:hypothetical protein [Bacteroidales bacterium]
MNTTPAIRLTASSRMMEYTSSQTVIGYCRRMIVLAAWADDWWRVRMYAATHQCSAEFRTAVVPAATHHGHGGGSQL